MSIFKNDYLLPKFINPNYRGLIGFKVYNNYSGHLSQLIAVIQNQAATISESQFDSPDWYSIDHIDVLQFTPGDIPIGELCWMSNDGKNWGLYKLERVHKNYTDKTITHYSYQFSSDGPGDWYYQKCVPYLIAETAEKAEELKGWAD